MAQTVINNGDSGLLVRTELNTMFAELYGMSPGRPAFVSGRTYPCNVGIAAASNGVVANTPYAVPVSIGVGVTIAALLVNITVLSAGNVKLAIYSDSGGAPANKLAETVSGSTGAVATLSLALSAGNLTLTPGTYWLVSLFDATPTATTITSTDPINLLLIGATTGAGSFGNLTGWTGSFTYAAGYPSSFGAVSPRANFSPRVSFTVA